MNRITIIICVLIFGISCRNSISEKVEESNLKLTDSVFSKINLPEMTEFDLRKSLNLQARKWIPLNNPIPIDSLFYRTFLEKDSILGYWKDYQKFYYAGTINYLNTKHLAISQWIGNGDECYIYLLNFKNGKIKDLLMIAKMNKSPDDYDCMKSTFENGKIIRTTIRNSSTYSDSIVEKFDIINYSKVYCDTIIKK